MYISTDRFMGTHVTHGDGVQANSNYANNNRGLIAPGMSVSIRKLPSLPLSRGLW
jgi:hypothetical protein